MSKLLCGTLRAIAVIALVCLVCGPTLSAAAASTPVRIDSIERVRHVPNPTGLQIGLFPNYRFSGDVLRDFGPRPIERANFHKWNQYAISPGEYDFTGAFEEGTWTHLAGASVVSNIDIFHTHRLNPQGMHVIPDWLEPDLTDPETRDEAKKFLRAFTQAMLTELGNVRLVIDYELFWFALPQTPKIRADYRDWYTEATQVARAAAAEIGMADQLQIGIIVNSDPFDIGERLIGSPATPTHVPQSWLLDCVRVADFIGIDTYAGGSTLSKTPDRQLDAVRFWAEHYALDKPVFITESGFSSAHEEDPSLRGYHARGTEAEQAEFYQLMFEALANSRDNADDPLSKVSAYCLWMYIDWRDQQSLLEKRFGLRRDDGTAKPALGVVREAIHRVQADPKLAPTRVASREDVTAAIAADRTVAIERHEGNDFISLEVKYARPPGAGELFLVIETRDPACVIAGSAETGWASTWPEKAHVSRLPLPTADDTSQTIEVMLTSELYPFATDIVAMRLVREPATSDKTESTRP